MSSFVSTVFRSTIGLLISKGRDKVAEILKDGDVTEQKFHSLIVKEINDVKSKLDALSRRDLGASISFFEEGIALLYDVFKIANARGGNAVTAQAAGDEASSLLEGIRRLELTGLDQSATRKLSTAKERFKDARRKATEAFRNEGLGISDRILAMKYRVMATILETVDNPADALSPCGVCIRELNSLPAVKNNFDVQFKKGFQAARRLLNKDERWEIISSVCHVNCVVYDVTQTFNGDTHYWTWPPVDTENNKINPVYDARLTEVLLHLGMEHCCVTQWPIVWNPIGIAINSSGESIVGDSGAGCVRVLNRNGKAVKHYNLPTNDENAMLCILDVATDKNDNIFALTTMQHSEHWCVHNLLTETKFSLRRKSSTKSYRGLSVGDTGKVVTLWNEKQVEEYDSNGEFVRSFGQEKLMFGKDITVANDGRVLVVEIDESVYSSEKRDLNVHIFSEHGHHLNKVKLQRGYFESTRITFHPESEHFIFASKAGPVSKLPMEVNIYSKDCKLVRSVQIQINDSFMNIHGITVHNDGLITVALGFVEIGEVVAI